MGLFNCLANASIFVEWLEYEHDKDDLFFSFDFFSVEYFIKSKIILRNNFLCIGKII